MRYAYADRNDSLGDPAFVDNPTAHLLSKDYAASIRAKIDAAAPPPLQTAGLREKPETTHYSVVDREGNAASVTYTLNGSFGALVMAPGTGVLLNDEMDDFTIKPGVPNQYGLVQGSNNAIAPGKRPLSSMSPTIVLKDGKPFLVLGSPGGSRIITATLEAAVNVIDYGMEPQAAVDAPRIHYQGTPDRIFVEPGALSAETRKALEGGGYKLEEQAPWCAVELVQLGAIMRGANDYRRPAGSAAGY
jgi:gamma-glutamyltranspeptidase/glutathione hydrolase